MRRKVTGVSRGPTTLQEVATGTRDLLVRMPPAKRFTLHETADGRGLELRSEDGTRKVLPKTDLAGPTDR